MIETIKKAMQDNSINSMEEAENAIEFVRNLLEIDIEKTEKNEPWATGSIEEMKVAVSRIDDLNDMLEELQG